MRSFVECICRMGRLYTVVVIEEASVERPRRYQVRPLRLLALWGAALLVAALVAAGAVTLTPLRGIVPGAGAAELQQAAESNARRIAALQDSLALQRQYRRHLRYLMTGQVDSAFVAEAVAGTSPATVVSGELAEVVAEPQMSRQEQQQEGPALTGVPSGSGAAQAGPAAPLPSLEFPVLPPVGGFVTRGFDAPAGHYAIDIAVERGTVVHAIGAGYVILADWTQEGGQALALQHADGYVSIYKHNRRLLKHVGDWVRAREPIALTGNSGEITTGPHLHVELWHNGQAQDPSQYFAGW